MNTRIKICCIATVAEAQEAIRAGADSIGLVAKMPSGPGPISDDSIKEISSTIPPGIDSFLLTSEREPATVVNHVLRCRTSVVQLVDSVPDLTYQALRETCPNVRIVQVLHVENEESIVEAHRISSLVDSILLDSGRPSASVPELGGTGSVHDWSISARIVEEVQIPIILAGGLNPENVEAAISQVGPFGVDLCSGVRTNGELDSVLLKKFIESVRKPRSN